MDLTLVLLKFSACNERCEREFNINFISQVMLGLPVIEGTNPASCFPFSVIGYEAACYSRIWSEVCINPISLYHTIVKIHNSR